MARPVIALLTDFGVRDHYVGAMKGVMVGICSEVTFIDISHESLIRHWKALVDWAKQEGESRDAYKQVEGEALLMGIKDVAVSSGSACTSASLEPSYVLRACGVEEELAHSSIRFGLGRFNTEEEVDFVIKLMVDKVNRLREMSPLYEMAKEGIDLKSIEWTAH